MDGGVEEGEAGHTGGEKKLKQRGTEIKTS